MKWTSPTSVLMAALYAALFFAFSLMEIGAWYRLLACMLAVGCAGGACWNLARFTLEARRYRSSQFYALFRVPYAKLIQREKTLVVYAAYMAILKHHGTQAEPYAAFVLEGENHPIDLIVVSAIGVYAFRLTNRLEQGTFTRLVKTLETRLARRVSVVDLWRRSTVETATLAQLMPQKNLRKAIDIDAVVNRLEQLGAERVETLDSSDWIA